MRAAAIEFSERKDGGEVVLLGGAAKIAFGADDVARQTVTGKPHDSRTAERLCVVCFGGLLEPSASGRLVLRPPLANHEQAPNGDGSAHVALHRGALVPVRRRGRVGGLAKPAKQHVAEMKLRRRHAGPRGRLQPLARKREIARTRPPVQIDRSDNAVSFPLPIAGGFVEPAQSLVRIRPDFEAGRKQRLSVALRELRVTG